MSSRRRRADAARGATRLGWFINHRRRELESDMRITEDLHIDCPPATAFDLMADVRNETRWNEDVSRSEITTDEPVGHGTQYVTDHGPSLGVVESTITMFDRPTRLDFSVASERMDFANSFTFTGTGSGTLVHSEFHLTPKGTMVPLFPELLPMIRRGTAKKVQNFKALCEAQAPSPRGQPRTE